MELSPENTKGLAVLAPAGKLGQLSDALFETLSQRVLTTIVDGEVEVSVVDDPLFETVDQVALKHAFAALVALTLECARHDTPGSGVSGTLSEQGVASKRCNVFAQLYESHVKSIIAVLRRPTFNTPRVVDVEWRADWNVKTSRVERTHAVEYHLTFKCVDGPDVQLKCTADQLQDLSMKVADAVKQLERVAGKE